MSSLSSWLDHRFHKTNTPTAQLAVGVFFFKLLDSINAGDKIIAG
jgi:hypothetical protein